MSDYLKGVSEREALSVMREAKEARDQLRDEKGFTRDRNMRLVARIPMSLYVKHPEFFDDPKLLQRFLNEHPEFKVGGGSI